MSQTHDKTHDIKPGQSLELLKELHILTRDGKMNQDSRRKLKQVYHLYQFIAPLMQQVIDEKGGLTLVDHGAGKSYLGFILYDLFFKVGGVSVEGKAVEGNGAEGKAGEGKSIEGKATEGGAGAASSVTSSVTPARIPSHIHGIETRDELVLKSRELAARLGFPAMSFLNLSVAQAIDTPLLPPQVDIVTALHACNTATDDAIRFALARHARFVVLVPCCQAEVANVLRKNKSRALGHSALAEIWRHPLHTREFGSQATNALRCLQLEAHGYQVSVTELVGWEHSMKNELIIAEYKDLPRRRPTERLHALLEELGLQEMGERFYAGAEVG
jgi:hypothetical protein